MGALAFGRRNEGCYRWLGDQNEVVGVSQAFDKRPRKLTQPALVAMSLSGSGMDFFTDNTGDTRI